MVKKIQIVQEETSPEQMDQADFQQKLLELLTAMDWKLWELYKLEQQRADREGITDETLTLAVVDTDSTFNTIRVDDDE